MEMTQKLEAESVSAGQAVDLAEVRRNLQAEIDELSILSAANKQRSSSYIE